MTRSEQPAPPAAAPFDESSEVARLQAEVARLQTTLAATQRAVTTTGHRPAPDRSRSGRWRPLVAGVLIAAAALTAPLSVLATWAGGQIQDTDRYLETVAPLASDPDVQAAVSARVAQVVLSALDLEDVTTELVSALDRPGLPPEAAVTLRALSAPLSLGVERFVSDRIDALVRSEVFARAWVEAHRTAHAELVRALTGDGGGTVQVEQGTVSVDVAVLVDVVRSQLVEAGFGVAERIPDVEASFAVVQSDELSRVQTLLGLLDDLALWLPVLGLVLLATAIVVARDRRRAVLASGLAVAAAMLLLGATLNAVRPFYLDALPASSSEAAAAAVYDQLVSFIRLALRGVLVVALTVAVVAWLGAEHGPGAAARRFLARGLTAARRTRRGAGLDTGGVGVALARFRGPIQVAAVGVASVAYLAQDHPTGRTALGFVVATGAFLLVVGVLADDSGPVHAEVPDERRV